MRRRLIYFTFVMVGLERLELSRLSVPVPKTGASTNSATSPFITMLNMVRVVGFEPTTLCSQNRCATKLRYTRKNFFETVERNKGIEPFSSAWKAKAQPLYQFRLILLYMLVTYIVKLLNWCPERELNPQGRRPIDFKSIVFTRFHHRGKFLNLQFICILYVINLFYST